jgi:hypothetical protein
VNSLVLNPAHDKRQHDARASGLSEAHTWMLFRESGIDPAIASERGYRTINHRAEVPADFKTYLRRAPALLIPTFSPDGITTSYQLRPDTPYRKKTGKTYRYASPAKSTIIADVHPRNMERIADPAVPLWITEGVKKGDSLASRGLCTIALTGVWMFRSKGSDELLPCFDHVALRGRAVRVVFDSDVMVKPEVQMALARLVGDLEARGAQVLVVYLPDAPEGSKQGVDDYLTNGSSVAHLEEMAQPFEPAEYLKTRLSRDARLRVELSDLWNTWERRSWGRHYSRRKVMRVLIEEAADHGKPVTDGIRVVMAWRPMAEEAGTCRNTVAKALQGLEKDDGLIQRDGFGKDGKTAAYVLLTDATPDNVPNVDHKDRKPCKSHGPNNNVSFPSGPSSLLIGPHLARNESTDDLKRLRYGHICRQWTGGGWEYAYIERLGPIRGHALEILIAAGGSLSVGDLIGAMNRRDRPSRFVERHVSKLVSYGLVMLDGDRVTLTDDWKIKLGMAREVGGEYEAEQRTKERHARQREAYRRRHETKADTAPTQREMDEARWGRKAKKPDGLLRELEQEAKHFVHTFVGRNDTQRPLGEEYPERASRRMVRAERPEPEPRKLPSKVGGVYQHGPDCECWVCSE